ncbi:MAG: glycosyltransferase, partial [Dehalococcoidia bacterium]|nr:glycosyltransferase [Dehalococcoidia bacterium]
KHVPGLQLALLGHLAMDDPQGLETYEQVLEAIGGDPDIYTFTNFTAASSIEVNAFQRYSHVVVQKSIREGFGLVVSEALWKGTPVVAGRVGGIPLQLEDGKGGFLIESVEECAEKVIYLLQHPSIARGMGRRGHRHIRSNYLTPRLLLDELTLLRSLG